MPKGRKTTFNVAAAAMLNCRILLFWSRDVCLHAILHLMQLSHTSVKYKTIFIIAAVGHLEFAKFRFFFYKHASCSL